MSEQYWAADMAVRMLTERSKSSSQWIPWIQTLPNVETVLAFNGDELKALGDLALISEIDQQQQDLRDAFDSLKLDTLLKWEDFIWGVQVFTSRCFYEPTLNSHLGTFMIFCWL